MLTKIGGAVGPVGVLGADAVAVSDSVWVGPTARLATCRDGAPAAPGGPLSQSCALETLGMAQSAPFQPLKPSILKRQAPVLTSVIRMRPSVFRTMTPNAP